VCCFQVIILLNDKLDGDSGFSMEGWVKRKMFCRVV
jgi:hypothetical protein